MIVHDREAADGDGEDIRKFSSRLDPFSAVDRAFAQQENETYAAGDAVMPTGYGRVDEVAGPLSWVGSPGVVDAVYPNWLVGSIVHCLS